MNWSAEQQRLLQALGHDQLVHGTSWPPRNVASPAIPTPAKAAPVAAKPGAPVGSERLQEALRRAAGGKDVSALVEDIEKLRNQPALKRALWPQLRALRRSH